MIAALPPIMNSAAWAEVLECSQKTVEERMRTGDLPGEKFGEGWICPAAAMLDRINEISVEKMLERRKAANDTPAPRLVAVGGAKRKPPELQ